MLDIKVLLIGYGGHGKTEFGKILKDQYGLVTLSSSAHAIPLIFETIKDEVPDCKTVEDLFANKGKYREILYHAIRGYNSPDKSRLSQEILKKASVYDGMRDLEEYNASRHLFDLVIWIDAHKRLGTVETGSINLTRDHADIIIENNGSLEEFKGKVTSLFNALY